MEIEKMLWIHIEKIFFKSLIDPILKTYIRIRFSLGSLHMRQGISYLNDLIEDFMVKKEIEL